ncbi:MAG: DUF350 domain-containing protein [Candidatus Xenobium sp.]|jgi:uncharacterized membrane protein YjfL (UPF0719 family)|nr:DUF350 domain-containing protein [Burkholderiales bacterium]
MTGEWVEALKTLVWALVASVAMSLSLGLLMFVWDKMTPRIDEWEELKKGNVAVAIVMAAVILTFGIVIASVLHQGITIQPPNLGMP